MAARRSTARDLAQIAIFAALIAALGVPGTLHLAGNAVPITLQTLGVMLSGSLLGARKGALAVATFLALVACGLPLLAGGRGGIQFLTVEPSAGYAWGFLAGSFVIGLLTQQMMPRYRLWFGLVANAVGGVVVVYLLGTLWVWIGTGAALGTALVRNGLFVPGDALKVVIASVVATQVHRAYPGLIARSRPIAPEGRAALPAAAQAAVPAPATPPALPAKSGGERADIVGRTDPR